MYTKIKTTHEEGSSDEGRTIGVLLNYNYINDYYKTFFYLYRKGTYIFFDLITDLIDFHLYGEAKMKRAYMEESEFDGYYDYEFEGEFKDKLKWL